MEPDTALPPPSSVLGLPLELQRNILSRLSPTDQRQARLVCRAWNVMLTPNSKFLSLPIELQFKILAFLTPSEQHGVRLTCQMWDALIKDMGIASVSLRTPEAVNIYQKSTFFRFGTLTVEGLKIMLPIYSADRIEIPGARHLVVRGGNSDENILALMRYYVQRCSALSLGENCMGEFKKAAQLSEITTFHTISTLTFSITVRALQFGDDGFAEQLRHLDSMSELLRKVNLPSLTSLSIHTATPTILSMYVRNGNGGPANFTKTMLNARKFVARHAGALRNLIFTWTGIATPFYLWMPSIEACTKLKSLSLSLTFMLTELVAVPNSLSNDLHAPLSKLTELARFKFDLKNTGTLYEQAANHVLRSLMTSPDCKIKELRVRCFDGLGWLSHFPTNLTKLELHFCKFFPLPMPKPTMCCLKVLVVSIHSADFPEGPDWRVSFDPWVRSVAPNLESLEIEVHRQPLPTLNNLQALVTGLSRLNSIKIKMNSLFTNEIVEHPAAVDQWIATFPPTQVQVIKSKTSWTAKFSRPIIPIPN